MIYLTRGGPGQCGNRPKLHIVRGEFVIPLGRATCEAIEGSIKGEVIEETAEVVYLSSLDGNGLILGSS